MDSGLRRSLQTLLHDFWKLLHFLSPLRGSAFDAAFPGARAPGCILAPLRGLRRRSRRLPGPKHSVLHEMSKVRRLTPEVRRPAPALLPSYQRTLEKPFLAPTAPEYLPANHVHPPGELPQPGGGSCPCARAPPQFVCAQLLASLSSLRLMVDSCTARVRAISARVRPSK